MLTMWDGHKVSETEPVASHDVGTSFPTHEVLPVGYVGYRKSSYIKSIHTETTHTHTNTHHIQVRLTSNVL